MKMQPNRFEEALVWHLLGTAFPREFPGSLLGCKLLFLKAVELKVAPHLKIKGQNLGVCGGKVPGWRAGLHVLVSLE